MREFSVPATVRVADDETLVDAVYANAAENGSAVAYRRRGADRQWQDVTAGQFAAEVTAVARGLVAAGVQAGDRVALLSRTRYEWTLVDYAILAVGAVTVPVYETSSAEQIRWILGRLGRRGGRGGVRQAHRAGRQRPRGARRAGQRLADRARRR